MASRLAGGTALYSVGPRLEMGGIGHGGRRTDMRNGAMAALGIAALAALAGGSPRSWAEGAVAVGSTGDVVRDGIAFGMVVN